MAIDAALLFVVLLLMVQMWLAADSQDTSIDKAESAFFKEIERVRREEPADTEMARAKSVVEKRFVDRNETYAGRARELARAEGFIELRDVAGDGRVESELCTARHAGRARLALQQVQRLRQRVTRLFLVLLRPEDAEDLFARNPPVAGCRNDRQDCAFETIENRSDPANISKGRVDVTQAEQNKD